MNPQYTFAPVIAAAYQYRVCAIKSLAPMRSKRAYALSLVNLLSKPEPPLGTFLPEDPLFSYIWEPENLKALDMLHVNTRTAYFLGLGMLAAECIYWLRLTVEPSRYDRMLVTFEPAANAAVLELAKNALDPNVKESQKVTLAQRKMAAIVAELNSALGQLQCEAIGLPAATVKAKATPRVSAPKTVTLDDLLLDR